MSRIYFHTRDEGEVELRGSERAHMGITCEGIAKSFLPHFDDGAVMRIVNPECRSIVTQKHFVDRESLGRILFSGFFGEGAAWYRNEPVNGFTVALNTALAIGDDPLRLFARLHGQCEIHAYVEGPNRPAVAEIMQRGLDSGLYRTDQGWEKVIEFVGRTDDAAVVTSYSVTESFPGRHLTDWKPDMPEGIEPGTEAYEIELERQHEHFYETAPHGTRWDLSMDALRRQSAEGANLEIVPGELSAYRFGRPGVEPTIFDLLGDLS